MNEQGLADMLNGVIGDNYGPNLARAAVALLARFADYMQGCESVDETAGDEIEAAQLAEASRFGAMTAHLMKCDKDIDPSASLPDPADCAARAGETAGQTLRRVLTMLVASIPD